MTISIGAEVGEGFGVDIRKYCSSGDGLSHTADHEAVERFRTGFHDTGMNLEFLFAKYEEERLFG
jgi:hypothetical protein